MSDRHSGVEFSSSCKAYYGMIEAPNLYFLSVCQCMHRWYAKLKVQSGFIIIVKNTVRLIVMTVT